MHLALYHYGAFGGKVPATPTLGAYGVSAFITENNKWSIQKRFQNDTYKIAYSPYCYDAVGDELVVNEQQAEIVRFIFTELLFGKSSHKIANELNHRSIPFKKGGHWTYTTIQDMVGNEKYTGDIIFQKTYTDACYNRHKNDGAKEQYYPTIINLDTFEAVEMEHIRRAKNSVGSTNQKIKMKSYIPLPFKSKKVLIGDDPFQPAEYAYNRLDSEV